MAKRGKARKDMAKHGTGEERERKARQVKARQV
jgi:hypothetical protein